MGKKYIQTNQYSQIEFNSIQQCDWNPVYKRRVGPQAAYAHYLSFYKKISQMLLLYGEKKLKWVKCFSFSFSGKKIIFFWADTRITFPKHHVLLLKISWREAFSAVFVSFSSFPPPPSFANFIICNLHLEFSSLPPLVSQLFPVSQGGIFNTGQGERRTGEERRGEEKGQQWSNRVLAVMLVKIKISLML